MISFLCCVIGYGYLLQERLGSLRVLTVHWVMPKCTFDLILSTWALLVYVNSLSLSLSKKHRQLLFKLSCWDVLFIFIIKCYWSISLPLSLSLSHFVLIFSGCLRLWKLRPHSYFDAIFDCYGMYDFDAIWFFRTGFLYDVMVVQKWVTCKF